MPPSAFPLPALGGPQWLRFVMLADDWPVIEGPEFYDGGQDTFCAATEPKRGWELLYAGDDLVAAAILDAHFASAKGKHLGFSLTWRDGTVYSNVKYESYERDHTNWFYGQTRRVRLIKRP